MNKIIGILKKWKNSIKLVLFMSIGSLVIDRNGPKHPNDFYDDEASY